MKTNLNLLTLGILLSLASAGFAQPVITTQPQSCTNVASTDFYLLPTNYTAARSYPVVGTTTSWAPTFGGNTTFNAALTVIQTPIRATLILQGPDALLNGTDGGPPYRVQRATRELHAHVHSARFTLCRVS
jgi:hypothetical protein